MRAWAVALLSLSSAAAIVCPPASTMEQKLKTEGEECGGPCDALGQCGEGLKCVVPQSNSLSFAILLGPARSGRCEGASSTKSRALLGAKTAGRVAGGVQEAEVDDAVREAAQAAVGHVQQLSNSLTPLKLVNIQSVTKQVVAGVKYVMVLELSDGNLHEVTVVDQPWMNPRFTFLSHSIRLAGEARKLAARPVAGGVEEAKVDDTVQEVAEAAVVHISKMSNSLTPRTLLKIHSVTRQVVAGVKYVMVLELSDGNLHEVTVVDQPWMNPRFTFLSHSIRLS